MNGRLGLLSALLALQVLVIAGFWLSQRSDVPASQNLLDFDTEQITRVEIDARGDTGDTSISLQRQPAGWVVEDYPVDAEKLTELLDKLSSLDSPWPVATTAEARERFEVTDDAYQKRVRLLAGENTVATLLLGTSPGFKRIHARRLNSDEVYSVALTSLDLPTQVDDWLDKSLLAADLEVSLLRRSGHWEAALQEASEEGASTTPLAWSLRSLAEPAASAVPANSEAIANLVNRFKSLAVTGIAADSGGAEADKDAEPLDQFELGSADGRTVRYQLFQDESGDQYSISREGTSGRFTLVAYVAEQLQAITEDLRQAEPAAQPQATMEAAEPPTAP